MPYFEQDEETGKISQQYSDEQFIEVVKNSAPASTSEVAGGVVTPRSHRCHRDES